MTPSHRRDDVSDELWSLLEPYLPGYQGSGRILDHAHRGASWRELPPDYGDGSNTHCRFIRWRDKGVWERLLSFD